MIIHSSSLLKGGAKSISKAKAALRLKRDLLISLYGGGGGIRTHGGL